MAVIEVFFVFALQLLIIVDPVAAMPVFLAITPRSTSEDRQRMAVRACLVAFLVVVFFILVGPALLEFLKIETPAVRICGGILLFVIALEMLYGRVSGTETSPKEELLAQAKEDISITPLAIPLLAGPGTIATALIFAGRAASPLDYLALLVAAAVVFAVSCLVLRQTELLLKIIGRLGTKIMTRIMGLILAFLAVQYVLDGLETAFT